jgi:hypothetical protein
MKSAAYLKRDDALCPLFFGGCRCCGDALFAAADDNLPRAVYIGDFSSRLAAYIG